MNKPEPIPALPQQEEPTKSVFACSYCSDYGCQSCPPVAPLLGQDHEIIYQRSLKATQELLSFLDISYQRGRKYANRLEVTIAICIEQNMKGIHR